MVDNPPPEQQSSGIPASTRQDGSGAGASARCPRCGAVLAGGAHEPCAVCLLNLGFAGRRVEPEARTHLTPAAHSDATETHLTPIYLGGAGAGFAGETLRTPNSAAAASVPHRIPDRIGAYRIVGELGEGGMGVVYLAEQTEPIRRTVAIKVIKLGMDTREVIARFEAERQALALMDHAHIASVLDAGTTTDGRPYFVMEYVAGVAITEYCDAHTLSIRRRLELFSQVCASIQHAHQKGVIHRDIKPSNVLVAVDDGHPVPKIIDFGVAKAIRHHLTERTLYTEQGLLIGTPEYMSPEQAEMSALDVDATTDIYSLGVLLYELLVGGLPFDSAALRRAGYVEIQRIIREDEPPRPSARLRALGVEASAVAVRRQTDVGALRRELVGDLDWITLRAMEKDRTRRYASASELAADLGRHLSDEPVVARPPSTVYRMRKFVRRNRGLVASLGFVFGVVCLGLVVSSYMYVRAEVARGEAEILRRDAVRQAYSATLVAAGTALDQLPELTDATARLALVNPLVAVRGGSVDPRTLLNSVQGDPSLLVAACAAFTEHADMFVQTEYNVPAIQHHNTVTKLNGRALDLYLRAKNYCEAAMEAQFPGIGQPLRQDPQATLARMTRPDVELLYWTAASWGAAIELGMDRPDLVIDLPVVRALAERALALDETWKNGAIHEMLISIESAPGAHGGSPERARAHFERAVQLQQGSSPRPYVALALGVALAAEDREEFKRLLKHALAIAPQNDPRAQLVANIYRRRARGLLDEIDLLFVK